ncbi:MsnO8 family LLM class oxidoreductase [Georgenia sp. Z1491]|uniref:MsnO8 family LLM class oxidoreductase n=1 Tax=Georgenia sp. Z1491 TaxID=3416707 RepID=UPI003CF36B9E
MATPTADAPTRLQVPISLLDRSRTREGEPAGAALASTVERAVRAERLGLGRVWVAEHHAVPGIASGAPPLLMAAIAARTERIRVASAGVMLPNHAPLVVAEQARMLEALHPGRIDLGVGRSLGFTAPVREALGVTRYPPAEFSADIEALAAFFADDGPVTAMPRGVAPPPVYVLAGRSGLAVAAERGLPVVVGGPILWGDLAALDGYRRDFRPSPANPEPRLLVSVDVLIAETADRARALALHEAWAMVESTALGAFPPLRTAPHARLTDKQEAAVQQHLDLGISGTRDEVAARLADLVARTGASEVVAFSSTADRTALAASDAALAELSGPAGG